MALHLSAAVNANMKSWSLGRKSSSKKKGSPDSSPPRPKSMTMSLPTASLDAELSSSIQASPSMASYSTSSPRSRKSSIENNETEASPSASKYLSTAQLKDKVRRLNKTTTSASNTSSRPPLSAKNNLQNTTTNGEGRVRTASLPSLIKQPIAASPSPSVPLVSPAAAAVIHGRPSNDFQESNPFSDTSSLESAARPPSPSPTSKRDPLAPLLASQADHDCDANSTQQPEISPLPPPKVALTSSVSSDALANSRTTEILSPKVEESSIHPTAVASLRRFKGVEGFGSLDKPKHARFDSMTVKESEEKEQIASKQQKSISTITIKEQQKYPFVIRKSKIGSNHKSQQQQQQQHHKAMTKRNARRVEVKYDVAIVTQRVLSFSFGQAKAGNVVVRQRRLLAVPIPSLFGADRAASWTVERISRLASCLTYVFGS